MYPDLLVARLKSITVTCFSSGHEAKTAACGFCWSLVNELSQLKAQLLLWPHIRSKYLLKLALNVLGKVSSAITSNGYSLGSTIDTMQETTPNVLAMIELSNNILFLAIAIFRLIFPKLGSTKKSIRFSWTRC